MQCKEHEGSFGATHKYVKITCDLEEFVRNLEIFLRI